MRPQPEFSPDMLRNFLFARTITREGFASRAQAARHDLAGELMAASGLAYSDIRAAFSGRLTDGTKRARLWAVLGHFPADYGITLDDEGRQHG
jgi:hypothetical protein